MTWQRQRQSRSKNCRCGGVLGLWLPIHRKCAFRWLCSIKSKVYLSPKLWYLRLSIIETQDLVAGDKGSSTSMVRFPEFFVTAQMGNQVLRARISMVATNRRLCNPFWNESLMFVVTQPFEDYLLILVKDRVAPGREEVVGRDFIQRMLLDLSLGYTLGHRLSSTLGKCLILLPLSSLEFQSPFTPPFVYGFHHSSENNFTLTMSSTSIALAVNKPYSISVCHH
ncbi:C2 domain [Dillenia turbinata]|uniref:C2 domain n=1 Tax=Dillenia turbinata TaxID=194707 RepID=A0AAN8VLL4_9MAGN